MEYRDETLQKGGPAAKAFRYLKKNGLKKFIWKIYRKIFQVEKIGYEKWRKENLPSEAELKRQREESTEDGPLFSVLVPLYRTPEPYLKAMIESVLAQTYGKWELILADGSGEEALLESCVRSVTSDPRVRYLPLKENLGIAGNTNAALAAAKGSYAVLLDHDDLLSPDALYEAAAAARQKADFIYSDEDKTDAEGKTYYDPHFKPDFNPDLLCSMNYICHMTAFSLKLAEKAGGFDQTFDGSQDYDFVFRCTEAAEKIIHIPKVLYHWRCHEQSTAAKADSKTWAFEAGKRAIEAHLERIGADAEVSYGTESGVYHVTWHLPYHPLVSILIPNKDHTDDLKKCIASLDRLTYQEKEIVIIENNSTEEKTFLYYKELEKRPDVKVVTYTGAFNYSAVNNFGRRFASGMYLLLLNNDTEVISEDLLEEMLGYGMRRDTGIVGAKLFYGDDTIQHAGVILGIGGVAGHAFQGLPRDERTYMWRAWCTQDLSAVTAACLLVRTSAYDDVKGLDEELTVAFNDVDFCLRVRQKGYLVVYDSEALLYHYESRSRGQEDTPEKISRFQGEILKMKDRWKDLLAAGDPYYNPNLSLEWQDFSCRSEAECRKARMDEEELRRLKAAREESKKEGGNAL